MSDLSMLINGLKVSAEKNATFERRNPLDGTVATRAPAASPADAKMAVEAAAEAFKTWGDTGPGERRALLLKAADKLDVFGVARALGELSGKAREGKLPGADMQGAGFTVTSLGGIGGTAFTPIINAPEVAILGVSKSSMKPVWDGKQFAPRLMLPLSLSYDHRVIDGALGARIAKFLADTLAKPKDLLGAMS